jgi:hypothetical protein
VVVMRSTRGRGGEDVPTSLFGLDDVETQPKKKCKEKKGVAQQCSAGNRKPGTLQDEPAATVQDELAEKVPPNGVKGKESDSVQKNTILKLSKAQWLRVQQVRMVGHWADHPDVVSYKIERPTASDPYYFWIHWDTAAGRAGCDKCGWQVAELNKHLISGKLQFKYDHRKQFTTCFR